MIKDKVSTGNEAPSLFTLSNAVQSPESTLFWLGHPGHFGQTLDWPWDLDGSGEGRDIPRHRGQQNFREPPQVILSGKWRHSFAGT